jgi:hypothetical protein
VQLLPGTGERVGEFPISGTGGCCLPNTNEVILLPGVFGKQQFLK